MSYGKPVQKTPIAFLIYRKDRKDFPEKENFINY
jgi:hypothetical protein